MATSRFALCYALDELFAERALADGVLRKTQAARAKFLGVPSSTLSRICSGSIPFTRPMVLRFTEALARSLEEHQHILKTLLAFAEYGGREPVPAHIADETTRMILDAGVTGNLEAVLEDIIAVYDEFGITTDRLHIALTAVRIQNRMPVGTRFDLGQTL